MNIPFAIRRFCMISSLFSCVMLASGCKGYWNAHYDALNKMSHTQNKFLFLAAMIDKYHHINQQYPKDLKEIDPFALEYFQSHPTFQYMYLANTWSKDNVDLFTTGTGFPIRYILSADKTGYYLYGSYGISAKEPLTIDQLREFIDKGKRHSGTYLVHNGCGYSGSGIYRVSDIAEGNMLGLMRPINHKHHSFID